MVDSVAAGEGEKAVCSFLSSTTASTAIPAPPLLRLHSLLAAELVRHSLVESGLDLARTRAAPGNALELSSSAVFPLARFRPPSTPSTSSEAVDVATHPLRSADV
jgi:hypothetical protein